MNDRFTLIIADDPNLKRLRRPRRADIDHHVWIIRIVGPPVVSNCMQHVIIEDTVFSSTSFDVH